MVMITATGVEGLSRRQAELVGMVGRGWHAEQLALLCNALGATTVTLGGGVGERGRRPSG